MALLIGGRFHVQTAAGVSVSGGFLRLYNNTTTTLATLYSDAALTVPLTNPVQALSDGWTPQIFAAEGTAVDGDFLTAGGAVIAGQSIVKSVFVGATSSGFTRDFTNSRAQITGAGGVVSWESGDPTGDDVGGAWRIGGWNGSQAVTGSLDAATTNTTGKFTENSKKLPGVVAVEGTFTAQANADIALVQTPFTGVRAWDLEIIDLQHGGAISFRTAYNSTPTFDTAAHYDYATITNGTYASAAGQTSIAAVSGSATSAADAGLMRLRIIDMAGTTLIDGRYYRARTLPTQVVVSAANSNTGVAVGLLSYLRLTPAAGTITCRYRLMPVRGFGET